MTELGKRLEEARKQKNLSLDELQSITKIQKRYLQAIENGKYEIMPGKFYARAFIKQYAEAVDIDPERLFEEFASEIPKTMETEVSSGLSRSQKKQSSVSNTSSVLLSFLPKFLVVVLVISVLVFIWLFWQKQDLEKNNEGESAGPVVESQEDENITIVNPGENKEENVPNGETEAKEEEPETVEEGKEPEEPVQNETTVGQQLTQLEQTSGKSPTTTYELAGSEQFQVELISNGRSYIGIENGMGKSFYAQELQTGEKLSYDFSAEQEIELNIGRTLDIAIKINGQDFEYPIPPSDKVHQKIKILFKKTIQQ